MFPARIFFFNASIGDVRNQEARRSAL